MITNINSFFSARAGKGNLKYRQALFYYIYINFSSKYRNIFCRNELRVILDSVDMDELQNYLEKKDIEFLFLFYRFVVLYSTFVDAARVRSIVIKKLITTMKEMKKFSIYSFSAALEAAEYDLFGANIRKLPSQHLGEHNFLYRLLIKDTQLLEQFYDQYRYSDIAYSDALLDKTLRFIGPLDLDSYKVDSNYDFLVYPKYLGGQSSIYPKNKIISYYSKGAAEVLVRNLDLNASNIAFMCVKNKSLQAIKAMYKSANVRVFRTATDIMIKNSGSQMLQSTVFDLLKFAPRRIDIVGVDFYTHTKNKSEIYLQSLGVEKTFMMESSLDTTSLRNHDPFSNFILSKKLFEAGVVNFDFVAKKILSLSTMEYAMKLDEIYSQQS